MLSNKKLANGEVRPSVSLEDFTKVFRVFSGAPFFENWTPEMVADVYTSLIANGGSILGYYIGNECVGILSFRPIIHGEHPVRYSSDSKIMYLSDIATLPDYRGNGIGTQLMEYGMRHIKVLGYDTIYLRTNPKGISMSYGIAQKFGFTQIWDLCEEVSFPRTNPQVPEKDLRIFMEKKL